MCGERERMDMGIAPEVMARCVKSVRNWESGEDYSVESLVMQIARLLTGSNGSKPY